MSEQKPNINELPRTAFIRLPDVLELYPVSKSSLWNFVRDGSFPKPTRIGKRAVAWRVGDVLDFLENLGDAA